MIDDILGLGSDILEIERIERLLASQPEKFIQRVLTVEEIEEYRRRAEKSESRAKLFLATRFCAKEAFSKAMGTGIGQQFSFQDLSVLNDEAGAPRMIYSERLEHWLNLRRALAKISISDEQKYVTSTVILFSKTII